MRRSRLAKTPQASGFLCPGLRNFLARGPLCVRADPRMEFLPVGPLAAAVIVIALAEGRAGFRAWGRRLIRWRVGGSGTPWHSCSPPFLSWSPDFANMALGASAPGLGTGDVVRAPDRLRRPAGQSDGRAPGRGTRFPRLRPTPAPGIAPAAAVRGDPRRLVALWHLPLVLFGGLSLIGLPTTFAITFLYVWLFNRTGGSVLLTIPVPQQPGHLHGRVPSASPPPRPAARN